MGTPPPLTWEVAGTKQLCGEDATYQGSVQGSSPWCLLDVVLPAAILPSITLPVSLSNKHQPHLLYNPCPPPPSLQSPHFLLLFFSENP